MRIGRRTTPTSSPAASARRVAIARAVVGERRLLLADEPSGALDSTNGEAVMRMILAACKQGVAAVVVTHDAQLASWADRVVFLRDGRVVDQTVPPPSSGGAARGEQSAPAPPVAARSRSCRPEPLCLALDSFDNLVSILSMVSVYLLHPAG